MQHDAEDLDIDHPTRVALRAGLDGVLAAPKDVGTVAMIVRRPSPGAREVLDVGVLDEAVGLLGDDWSTRSETPKLGKQLNVVSSRVMSLVCPDPARRPLAGDQLHLDLDLSVANLPTGTRLAVGEAVIEVTPDPHRGCVKWAERFGDDARSFVLGEEADALRLRGLCARVVRGGTVRRGDAVRKLTSAD